SPTIARLRAGPYFYAGYWRQSPAMTRLFIRTVVIAGYITIFLADALCQQPHAKRSPTAGEPGRAPRDLAGTRRQSGAVQRLSGATGCQGFSRGCSDSGYRIRTGRGEWPR